MSRPAASKSKPRAITVKVKAPIDAARADRARRALLHTSAAFVFIAGCAVGLFFMRRHVEKDLAFPSTPPKVVLKERPAWMTDLLAAQIVRSVKPAGAHSAFDHQLLVDVGQMLSGNPWIKRVRQVRRLFD